MSDRCSVEMKCSSAGRACDLDDRACQSSAIASGLEITCEHLEPRAFIYCPPGAEQRDSKIVWILLCVALVIALVGGLTSIVLLRRKTR